MRTTIEIYIYILEKIEEPEGRKEGRKEGRR
jgi:hypothetical protein